MANTLTRDEMVMTELDASIMFRLAYKQAHARPHWFEAIEKNPDRYGSRVCRAERVAVDIVGPGQIADRGAMRAAHLADCMVMANMSRWSRSDWLPSVSIEMLAD